MGSMTRTDTDDMKLPDGKTCLDCTSFRRCRNLIGIKGKETSCDWSPSRFHEDSNAALLADCRAVLDAVDKEDTRDLPEELVDRIRALLARMPERKEATGE